MRVTERERKQYLNQIKKLLVCKGTQRKQFMNSFSDNVDEYLNDNPDADFAQLQKDMGTPQEIADAFLENESASHIKKRMSIVRWVIIGIIIALLLFVFMIVFIIIDARKDYKGYTEETITVESVSEDNFQEEIIVEEIIKEEN